MFFFKHCNTSILIIVFYLRSFGSRNDSNIRCIHIRNFFTQTCLQRLQRLHSISCLDKYLNQRYVSYYNHSPSPYITDYHWLADNCLTGMVDKFWSHLNLKSSNEILLRFPISLGKAMDLETFVPQPCNPNSTILKGNPTFMLSLFTEYIL